MGGETKSYKMDFSELTKNVVDRIQKLEPDNVTKIMGCIFLKDPSEQEMLQLAFGPENILLTKIDDAKTILGILSPKNAETSSKIQSVPNPSHHSGSFPPGLDSRPFSSPPALHANAPYWDPHLVSDQHPLLHNMDFTPYAYTDLIEEDYKDVIASSSAGNYYYQDATFGGSLPSRTSRRSPSLPEFPIKTCHYFSKGYCKHGANCRYFHGHSSPDAYSQTFSQNFNDFSSEEHGFSPGSLEKLEMEITELLRSRKGIPVSIASLPMLYYEKYGRNLQAEGYLTESQRHGKTGFSLTKLLARLKTSIRLIDRPHGQHSVILAEDAPGYFECRNERSEMGSTASSHQIYLTFPAESTFTEDDVSNYFKQFGPVRDVRIPCQDKRMFGFVSFSYPQTVSDILMKRNPHYICGSRVLVKPYREKSRMDRTFLEKMKPTMCHPSHCVDLDSELHAMPRGVESSRISKQHFEEQESLLEHERRRFSDFNLVQKPLNRHSYFSCGVDDLQLPEDPINFALEDNFSYKLESLSTSSDDKTRSTSISCKKQESGQMELFESLFACPPPIGSSASSLYRDSETKAGENRDTQKKQHSLLMKSSMILNNQPPPVPPH